MRILKSYAVVSLFTGLLAILPVAVTLVSAPAEAMHCEFLESGCGGDDGGVDGGGGGSGGGGSGPVITISCPAGYRVYCTIVSGQPTHCTCRKETTDGGTP